MTANDMETLRAMVEPEGGGAAVGITLSHDMTIKLVIRTPFGETETVRVRLTREEYTRFWAMFSVTNDMDAIAREVLSLPGSRLV